MSETKLEFKITPRDKADITKFINFHPLLGLNFEQFSGKIVYLNAEHPDKHIYQAYYMLKGMAYRLSYINNSVDTFKKEYPLFTLQELHYDDIIIFYTQEDNDRRAEQKKKLEEEKKNQKK